MKKVLIFFSFILSHIVNAQQESKIRIDSGKRNTITVNQQNNDSLQNSDISLSNADSNKLQVEQNGSQSKKNINKGLLFYLNNFKVIISIILGILAIGTYVVRRKKKRPKTKK
jgi:hypothetical protein